MYDVVFILFYPSPSSSSLGWWLESLSFSEDAVSMKTNPIKREEFSGRGPCVATRSLESGGRSAPLPDVLQAAIRCPVQMKQKENKYGITKLYFESKTGCVPKSP